MVNIKALVLTYDRQIGLAELLVKCYLRLWKECPFQFVIPRHDDKSQHFDFLVKQKNVSIVQAPSSIRGTMSVLLEPFDDDAWVYWCIDDRYPVKLDKRRMKMIIDFIASGAAESLNGIKLIHWRETADAHCEEICIGDTRFRFQVPYSTWGFWHHQLVRAKVLKNIFLASSMGMDYGITELNSYFNNLPFISTFEKIVFPVEQPIVQFGETLVKGSLTANACKSLIKYHCPIPPYGKDSRSVIFMNMKKQMHANPNVPKVRVGTLKKGFRRIYAWIREQRCESKPVEYMPRVRVLVSSFGGVGSKCLLKGLLWTKDERVLNQSHAHLRVPPAKNYLNGRKMVYLFGDPYNALISFFNRRERNTPSHGFKNKEGGGGGGGGGVFWVVKHCKNLSGDYEAIDPNWDLMAYLENGVDLLKMEEHFDNWVNAKTDYPILFIRYETMWDHLRDIYSFLGLPESDVSKFPSRQPRGSCWHDESEQLKVKLVKIYGSLYDKIANCSDIWVGGKV